MDSRSRSGKCFAALLALIALACAVQAAPTQAAEPRFAWLCKPGKANDPCAGSLLTEKVGAGGPTGRFTPQSLPRLRSRIDCFYVYPTVSSQTGPNATLARDPEVVSIAEQQAARFAPGCRVFAPIYRQYTVPAILSGEVSEEATDTAYGGVKSAWGEYLRKYNKGRGIVLVGHSQGTGHLKRLITETFDRKPNLRKRLVSAVLIGGNVIVPKGRRVGGSFRKVPGCVKATELGCVIAYSGFLEDAQPADSLFGRVGGALSESGFSPETHEVLCVNPARLDGSKGKLKPLYSTTPFPGIYGPLLPDLTGYEVPWVSFPGIYSASCQKSDGASWLNVRDTSTGVDGRPRIGEPLGRTWGTHLTEVNDAAGNLASVVITQEKTWLKKLAKAKRPRPKIRP